jgi:nitrile hydratase accessory protein
MTYVRPETWSSLTCGRAILNRSKSLGPHDTGFTEPWQAEALALSIALQESGLFSPAEWSDTLGEEIEKARPTGDPADGTIYYKHVVAALERLVAKKGLLSTAAIDQRRHDWEEAYRHTPHGRPVVLATDAASE